MVVVAAAPCRTQLRHLLLRRRVDIRAEQRMYCPLRKKKKEHRQREEAGEADAAGHRERLCRTNNLSARIPAIYPALLGRCALTRDDDLLVTH